MTCAGCKETVTRALENIDKVKSEARKKMLMESEKSAFLSKQPKDATAKLQKDGKAETSYFDLSPAVFTAMTR